MDDDLEPKAKLPKVAKVVDFPFHTTYFYRNV